MKSFLPFLVFLILIRFPACGQDSPKRIPKHKTVMSIGLTASPDIYIYEFKAYPDFSLKYSSQINYSTGITLVYYPVKLLSIRASILYSTKGFSLDYNYNAVPPGASPDSLASKTRLIADYLDIPVILHLNLIHRDRVQFFLAAGVVPGILMQKAQQTLFRNNTERNTDDISRNFNSFLAGTIYSIGFKYNFSQKFGLGIDPYFRYYLNRIDKHSMSSNPVSFGGKISLYINFIHKQHRGKWGK